MSDFQKYEYLTIAEVLELHEQMIAIIGGSHGVRDLGAVESSVAQPQMTFGGDDLYVSLSEKSAALGYSLIKNHPFIDGNKRVGHAAMRLFLNINGYDLVGEIDDQEKTILSVASGEMSREDFTAWVQTHVQPYRA